jgi:hypothetical protein
MAPDPFRVLADAYRAGDERLSALILEWLFPWVRGGADGPRLAPAAARRAVLTLCEQLGISV